MKKRAKTMPATPAKDAHDSDSSDYEVLSLSLYYSLA